VLLVKRLKGHVADKKGAVIICMLPQLDWNQIDTVPLLLPLTYIKQNIT